jgi:hypothetical protein
MPLGTEVSAFAAPMPEIRVYGGCCDRGHNLTGRWKIDEMRYATWAAFASVGAVKSRLSGWPDVAPVLPPAGPAVTP